MEAAQLPRKFKQSFTYIVMCVDTKIGTMKVFWTIWAGQVRPLPWTGQTGLDKFVKLQIRLYHCVYLVETIEMHI